jgi:eukaryotic-like serine/threonine-protein kinase
MPADAAQDIAVAQEVKKSGMATPEQISTALQAQAGAAAPLPLADALVKLGVITAAQKDTVLRKVAEKKGVSSLLHYRLMRKIGEGGMGAVYLAEDTQALKPADKKVALKVLPRHFSATPDLLKRFRREADTATRLRHPNVVGAFASGEDAGFHFYVMEYCEGETLDRLLRRGETLPIFKAAEIVAQAARGLRAAHELGFVHRDVKPANIILTPQGQAKVLDLGLTKNFEDSADSLKTQSGAILGTPHYIAPEQARGAKGIDGRADIYSLGATFYHLLSGDPPYKGQTGVEVIYKHVHEPLPDLRARRADLPAGVEAIVKKMLAKGPEDRYASCAELVEDLEAFLAGKIPGHAMAEAGKETTITPPARASKRGPLLAGAGAAALAVVAVLAFRPPEPPAKAVEAPLLKPAGLRHAEAATAAQAGEVDLLKGVDPKRDAVEGVWSVQQGELVVSDGAPARLRLPFQAPAAYDLRAEFTRMSGGDVVTLVLARQGRSFLFQLGGFGNTVSGFSKVDDQRSDANPTTVKRGIKDGASYVCVVEVRPDRVTALLDGKKLSEWTPAAGKLEMDDDWSLKEDGALGVGSWGSPTTFHALKLTPR